MSFVGYISGAIKECISLTCFSRLFGILVNAVGVFIYLSDNQDVIVCAGATGLPMVAMISLLCILRLKGDSREDVEYYGCKE